MPPQQLPSGPWRAMLHVKPSYLAPGRVTLNVKLPMSEDRIPVEMAENDIVLKLKEKIVELEGMQGVTMNMIVLCPCLGGGRWSHKMDVFLKWSGPVRQGSSSASSRNQMVGLWIHTPADQGNLEKKLIQVNPVDNVSRVLRNQMEQWERRLQFPLPPRCAYYFLYKQQVMNQQESFDWHGVSDGDTIRVFVGYVTDTVPCFRFNNFDGFYYF